MHVPDPAVQVCATVPGELHGAPIGSRGGALFINQRLYVHTRAGRLGGQKLARSQNVSGRVDTPGGFSMPPTSCIHRSSEATHPHPSVSVHLRPQSSSMACTALMHCAGVHVTTQIMSRVNLITALDRGRTNGVDIFITYWQELEAEDTNDDDAEFIDELASC